MHRQYRSPTLILTAAHCVHYQGRPKGLTEAQVTASLGKPIVERIHWQRRSPSRLVARSEHSRRIRSLTLNEYLRRRTKVDNDIVLNNPRLFTGAERIIQPSL